MLRSSRLLLIALVLAALAVASFRTATALSGLGALGAQAERVLVDDFLPRLDAGHRDGARGVLGAAQRPRSGR